LISLDVDGTQLDSKGSLHPRNEAALRMDISKGVIIILNKGKPINSIAWLIDRLGLTDPVVTLSGAQIVQPNGAGQWDTLKTIPISPNSLQRLADLLVSSPLSAFICTDHRILAFHPKSNLVYQGQIQEMMSKDNLLEVQTLHVSPFPSMRTLEQPILKLFLYGD